MSAGDVQFVGWTGGDPLYKELRPTIQYEPIQQSGISSEENPYIEKRVTRNLLCFEKDRDAVLSQLLKPGETLKSVYIDTDGSAKELDFGDQWQLLSVSEATQAIGFIRISAQYKKSVSKALEVQKPTGINIYSPSAGIVQIRYNENVLEQIETGVADGRTAVFSQGLSFVNELSTYEKDGLTFNIRQSGWPLYGPKPESWLILEDYIDKNKEYAFARMNILLQWGQVFTPETFSVSFNDILKYPEFAKKVDHLHSVEILSTNLPPSDAGVRAENIYRELPRDARFSYMLNSAKLYGIRNPIQLYIDNDIIVTTPTSTPAPESAVTKYAKDQMISSDIIQELVTEWQNEEDGNYAVVESSYGSIQYLITSSLSIGPPVSIKNPAPYWVHVIYRYKKQKDAVKYSNSNILQINWETSGNIIRLKYGPFVWKEYDVTGLT